MHEGIKYLMISYSVALLQWTLLNTAGVSEASVLLELDAFAVCPPVSVFSGPLQDEGVSAALFVRSMTTPSWPSLSWLHAGSKAVSPASFGTMDGFRLPPVIEEVLDPSGQWWRCFWLLFTSLTCEEWITQCSCCCESMTGSVRNNRIGRLVDF